MRTLRKRIEALERAREHRRKQLSGLCICYPHGTNFHSQEERELAAQIPCPIHGLPRFTFALTTLPIDSALGTADRHLCHCPPMLARQAEEEGRTLIGEELKAAERQYAHWWTGEARRKMSLAEPGDNHDGENALTISRSPAHPLKKTDTAPAFSSLPWRLRHPE